MTGATGRLGQRLLGPLQAAGHTVRQMSRRGTGPGGVRGDLATGRDLDHALAGAEVVIHAASDPRGDYWNTDVTALVSRGYVVIAPNVRGSTGYGMEFQRANIKDLGGGDLQDEVYAAKFLESTGYVDSKKIGIMRRRPGYDRQLVFVQSSPTDQLQPSPSDVPCVHISKSDDVDNTCAKIGRCVTQRG